MLYIKCAYQMISVDISEGVAVLCIPCTEVSCGAVEEEDYKGNLIIKTPAMCYTFQQVEAPDIFADLLGSYIIKKRQKNDIVVDMNALVKCEQDGSMQYMQFLPESIEVHKS